MELPEEENTPEKRVDRIFAMMDKVSILYVTFYSLTSNLKLIDYWFTIKRTGSALVATLGALTWTLISLEFSCSHHSVTNTACSL